MTVDDSVYRQEKLCNVERVAAGELYTLRVYMVRLLSSLPHEKRTVDQALRCRAAVLRYMRARRSLRRRYGQGAITPGLRIAPRARA